ncbi:MAG: hypothetical protein ABSC94_23345 [Polyangiaceae bacterium]|jgi:hypothetical protein
MKTLRVLSPVSGFLVLAAMACGPSSPAGATPGTDSDGASALDSGEASDGLVNGDSGLSEASVSCPRDLPTACPNPVPSYASTIAPIVMARCSPCHFPGGVEAAQFDFSVYANIANADTAVVNQIYSCMMPPTAGVPSLNIGPAPALTLDERADLLGWLVCGAPNN